MMRASIDRILANRRALAERMFVGAVATMAAVGMAQPQWTVTNLQPAGAPSSYANGVFGDTQVGQTSVGGGARAAIWNGSAGSWMSLHPMGNRSAAYAVDEGQQVGWVRYDGDRAALWTGTAASWVDLHPAGAASSFALGVSEGVQVGYANIGGFNHAGLWKGDGASWIDLHTPGAISSIAQGVRNGRQVGYSTFGADQYHAKAHAGIWSGSAGSWADLNPSGADYSYARAIFADQIVGLANIGGQDHAGVWTSDASSWVDLNPAGATHSDGVSVFAGFQVGHATIDGIDHAGVWQGTAASWRDLSVFLPEGFTYSYAQGIWSDSVAWYVAGYGTNTVTGRDEALVWKRCHADFNDDGTVDFFDYDSFVTCFEGTACPPGKDADFDQDGAMDFFDYDAFVRAFETTC